MDIRAVRQSLKLSQAALAERLGVTQATISRFESGLLKIDERTKLAIEALQLRSAA
jgi:transcriptional regulator with XRE-family HTH domain